MAVKIVYITNISRKFSNIKDAFQRIREQHLVGEGDSAEAVTMESTDPWTSFWEKRVSGASLVLIRYMGSTTSIKFLRGCLRFLRAHQIPYYLEAPGSVEGADIYHLSPREAGRIKAYGLLGGMVNDKNLLLYAFSLFGAYDKPVDEPREIVWAGIYHPGMEHHYMTDLTAYRQKYCQPERLTVGLFFYRSEWLADDLGWQRCFIGEAEKMGMNVIPVFSNGTPDPKAGMPSLKEVFTRFFCENGRPVVDVIVNMESFSLVTGGSITVDDLYALGVPILQAYSLTTPLTEWEESEEGMSGKEVSINVALPELEGVIQSVPIAAKQIAPDGHVEHVPIPERIHFLLARAEKWARLRHKANRDKKVAIVFHNYPPTNATIGSAYGLDSIESIRRLLSRMKKAGYQVDWIPEDTRQFMKLLTSHATNDISMLTDEQMEACQKLDREGYLAYFKDLPEKVQKDLEKYWGKAPGTVMLDEAGRVLVPGTMDGHVFITVQPPRGYGVDPEKTYHDVHVPPTHQYLAVYEWIRDVWQADVVLHVGTHGNLEWLPGKGAGMDEASYPGLALGDMPNVYIYHMTITGEGIQAKRRGSACLVDHFPAPLDDAGAYDELAELDKNLDEYSHFLQTDPSNAEISAQLIRKLAVKAHLDEEVPYDGDKPFQEYAGRLHSYLESLENSETHVGLHVLGAMPEGPLLKSTLLQLLRLPNGDEPSIWDLFAERWQTSTDELVSQASVIFPSGHTGGEILKQVKKEADAFVSCLYEEDFTEASVESAMALPFVRGGGADWKARVHKLAEFICRTLMAKLRATEEEETHVMDGFSGTYVKPGPSGSPHAGGVALLPSGRNFYGIDPRRLPTQAAWILGQKLGDQVIEDYIASEGTYPENVGMVLWSGANMRSNGQCIAEFLYFLGIRPVWQPGSLIVKDLEVIPLSELKRPRIDVMGRISGFFRDSLSVAIDLLDKAVTLAAGLDEDPEQNYLRKHALQKSGALREKGVGEEEAWRQATYRIFGDAPGTYGTGVSTVLENKNWETLADLSDVFVKWGGYAYGAKAAAPVPAEDLFKERLSVTNVTIKNEDNHETSIMSSDDFNGYHGGMIAAVRHLSGKTPHSYSGDSADRCHVKVRSVQAEFKRIFRTETINPKFIEGMMKHGYKGAQDLSSRMAISFQWDATSQVMEDWMYEKMARTYALDYKVQDWMKNVNPWALERITETLLEANKRNMWQADEKTLDELQDLYLSIEGDLEGISGEK